jgi:two-component system heavy metal sensor histidine kinase CusS
MNTKSLKFRLSLYYFLVLTLAGLALTFFFYLTISRVLISQTDQEILSHSRRVIDTIATSNPVNSLSPNVFHFEFTETPGMLILLYDHDGKFLNASQPLPTNINPATLLPIDLKNLPDFFTERLSLTRLRFGLFEASDHYILIGHPIDAIYSSLRLLSFTLIFLIVTITIIANLGGFLIASISLRPLAKVSSELNTITSKNLNKELTNPQTGDEIESLVNSFNSLLKKLHQSLTRERQFIADVTHELKTPISTLKSSLEIALTKPRSVSYFKDQTSKSLIDLDRLIILINDILDLAASETPSQQKFTTTDLSHLVSEALEVTEKLAQEKNLRITKNLSSNILIFGNPNQLFRAVFNLLDNAVKYTPKKGFLHIKLVQKSNLAILSVSNSGTGIKAKDLPRIFDRFYRAGQSSNGGTGLGLAITKSVITSHSGTITVKSNPGKRTTFIITLPIFKN